MMDAFGTSAELLPTHEDWLRAGHSLQFIMIFLGGVGICGKVVCPSRFA